MADRRVSRQAWQSPSPFVPSGKPFLRNGKIVRGFWIIVIFFLCHLCIIVEQWYFTPITELPWLSTTDQCPLTIWIYILSLSWENKLSIFCFKMKDGMRSEPTFSNFHALKCFDLELK